MRRLTHDEGSALLILAKRGSLVPGDSVPDWSAAGLMEASTDWSARSAPKSR